MKVPLAATVLVLIIWLIASPNCSCNARIVVPDDFDLFDYGVVHHNTQTDHEGFSQEAFPEGWETEATTRDSLNRANAQTEEYDPQQAFLEAWEAKTNTFNVVDYGAVGNGLVDDTKAFLKAWGAMCASSTQGNLTLVVPQGKRFLLNAVAFEGPCRASKVNFQIQGSIVAPNDIGAWTNKEMWIQFSNVQGLSVNGGGRIDGNGAVWWKACGSKGCQRPTALHFNKCHGFQLSRLAFFNSPKNHISICSCNGPRVFGLLIWAPEDSPNTDGIDISHSTRVTIQSSHIATGDDCIAINSGSSYIKIRDIKCGPGHGISIGSLGEHGEYSQVEEVQVSNCTFKGTTNGVRIKTWEGGSGYARKITFEGITFEDTKNPIVIDQHYFAKPTSAMDISKSVQVSDVTYRNINGTCADEKAITLACTGGGCTNIVMDNVTIKSDLPNKRSYAYCDNAHGTSSFSVPSVPCLSH
ncbi:unnamed protein product [Prunus brigantina]